MRQLIFIIGLFVIVAVGVTGCNTTYPGTLGFATWEFQFSHKKPVYPISDVSQPIVTQQGVQR